MHFTALSRRPAEGGAVCTDLTGLMADGNGDDVDVSLSGTCTVPFSAGRRGSLRDDGLCVVDSHHGAAPVCKVADVYRGQGGE